MTDIPHSKSNQAAICYSLHYFSRARALALVVPDNEHPGMWRIHWPDGRRSDLGNLSRIRDAAVVIAASGQAAPRFSWRSDAEARRGLLERFSGSPGPLTALEEDGDSSPPERRAA